MKKPKKTTAGKRMMANHHPHYHDEASLAHRTAYPKEDKTS